jgi:hypothetical protein
LAFRRVEQGLHGLTTKDTDVDWNFCILAFVGLYNDTDKSRLVYIPKTNSFFYVFAIPRNRDAQNDGRTDGHCEFNIRTSYLVYFSFPLSSFIL